jgi:RNA polymerase sigma-70 factor (ECF subfamily)
MEPPEDDGRAHGIAPRPIGGADPGEVAVADERRGVLQQALDQLPDEFRLPVVLRDVADLDYAEIAEQLGLPPGTVRSRIARGRAKLATLLAGTDLSPGNHRGAADVSAQDAP